MEILVACVGFKVNKYKYYYEIFKNYKIFGTTSLKRTVFATHLKTLAYILVHIL